MLLTDAAYL